MEQVSQALYKALRDDSEATNGIRALLGNTTANPYNCYFGSFPESFDFSPSGGAKGLLVYSMVSCVRDTEFRGPAAMVAAAVEYIAISTKVPASKRQSITNPRKMLRAGPNGSFGN